MKNAYPITRKNSSEKRSGILITRIKNCFEIAFSTSDVKSLMEKAIACGANELKPPELKPWGQTVSYVEDPFGTIIEICTVME